MTLIELTADQWEGVHQRRDSLLTELTGQPGPDSAAIEAGVRACYEAIVKQPPAIVWVDGPTHVLAAGAIVQNLGKRGQLGDQLRGQLGGQLGDQLGGAFYSGWWIAYLEFYLAINDLPGIKPADSDLVAKATAMRDALKCHFWLPLDGICIISKHHTALRRDNQRRLHCTDGPAWAWADGTEIHALEGIRIPEWVVDSDVDPSRFIADLDNAEQRRVAFANYGWDRAIEHLGMAAIDRHEDPHVGSLYRLPDTLTIAGDPMNLLVVRNASPHPDGTWATYGLTCPPDTTTAEEAQASLLRISVDEWRAIEVHT